MRRSLLLTILSMTWLLATVGVAHASCLSPPSIEQAIEEAPVVFVGTVVDFGNDERQAIVEVESVWKGEGVAALVSVDGGYDPKAATSVDRYYEAGVRYLFVPTSREVPFTDNACTSTQVMTDELATLQPRSATAPIDGETVIFGDTGGDGGIVAPPPSDVVGFGSDEEPAVPVLDPGVVEEPGFDPQPQPRALASSGDAQSAGDSYLLPMLAIGVVVALSVGGAAVVRRLRGESIE